MISYTYRFPFFFTSTKDLNSLTLATPRFFFSLLEEAALHVHTRLEHKQASQMHSAVNLTLTPQELEMTKSARTPGFLSLVSSSNVERTARAGALASVTADGGVASAPAPAARPSILSTLGRATPKTTAKDWRAGQLRSLGYATDVLIPVLWRISAKRSAEMSKAKHNKGADFGSVELNRRRILIDGVPRLVLAGEVHYFAWPGTIGRTAFSCCKTTHGYGRDLHSLALA